MKIHLILGLIIASALSAKADNLCKSDTLEIDYDGVYAVHWDVNIFPVANIYTFPQDDVDRITTALLASDKELLFQGNWMMCYYLNLSLEEAEQFKQILAATQLPHGYDWKFGLFENENQGMALIAAVVESAAPFNVPVGHAYIDKDPFGQPAIGFSLMQCESDEPAIEYRKYCMTHNCVVMVINDRMFAPTQLKQLSSPDNGYITISYVPKVIIHDLYHTH